MEGPAHRSGPRKPNRLDDYILVCTVEWPKSVTDREKVIPDHHLACYRAATGELLWDALIPPGPWLRPISAAPRRRLRRRHAGYRRQAHLLRLRILSLGRR